MKWASFSEWLDDRREPFYYDEVWNAAREPGEILMRPTFLGPLPVNENGIDILDKWHRAQIDALARMKRQLEEALERVRELENQEPKCIDVPASATVFVVNEPIAEIIAHFLRAKS